MSEQRWAHRVLVALGGNAMSAPDGSATEEHQIAALTAAAGHIADLVADGYQVALTHGNGPQVGNLLVKNELAAAVVPPVSLDWCVAQTQATIGFVLTDALEAALADRGAPSRVATLVSRTLVDEQDPAFRTPSKPVGRYRTAAEAVEMMRLGQQWQDFGPRGWRRVVSSPQPVAILDAPVGRDLLDAGTLLIMSGGGGVPVVRRSGRLHGVEAVIDKDLTAALLGHHLGCDTLIIATDVDQAVLRWGTPEAEPVRHVSLATMARYTDEGHFAAGSMGPKVLAACRFVNGPGTTAIITRLDRLAAAVKAPRGSVGTTVTTGGPDRSTTEPVNTKETSLHARSNRGPQDPTPLGLRRQ